MVDESLTKIHLFNITITHTHPLLLCPEVLTTPCWQMDQSQSSTWIAPLPTGQHGISKAMKAAKKDIAEEREKLKIEKKAAPKMRKVEKKVVAKAPKRKVEKKVVAKADSKRNIEKKVAAKNKNAKGKKVQSVGVNFNLQDGLGHGRHMQTFVWAILFKP